MNSANSLDRPAPRLSVVIPTYCRVDVLAHAVHSALTAEPSGDVEVIVVPNGSGTAWRAVQSSFIGDSRVTWHPLDTPNACAARNHGMRLARGEFLRFLDDDDFFIPDGAQDQYQLIERTGADICSAPIQALDDEGQLQTVLYQPDTPDFPASVMSHRRMHQPTAHLFRREAIRQIAWNETLAFSQDNDWMLRVASIPSLKWVKSGSVAGAWVRHSGSRISTSGFFDERKRIVAEGILKLARELKQTGSLTPHRAAYAASGLWDCVHQAMFMSPGYWMGIAAAAREIAPGSHPDIRLHNMPVSSFGLRPELLELLIAPKRGFAYLASRLQLAVGLAKHW